MRDGARAAAALAIAVVAIAGAVRLLLHVPGVPYNVRELFLDNGSLLPLLFFALTLLWIGAGARLVTVAAFGSRWPALVLPLALVAVSLVSKMLVSRAVTYESLDDILGSDNLFGLVVDHNVWGAAWRARFLAIGGDTVDFLERRVRYCALYSLPTLWIAVAFAAVTPAMRRRHTALQHALVLGVAVVWTWLCGTIVLTWAATDNLTELIAATGPFGVAGPLWLLVLVLVLAANGALITTAPQSAIRAVSAAAATALCVPVSWWLLNAGLEQHVQKYGVTFPAAQFLLGPDRQHALSTAVLFARWTVVYLGGVTTIAAGGWLVGAFAPGALTSRAAAAADAAS
jgi:hypothetical protein